MTPGLDGRPAREVQTRGGRGIRNFNRTYSGRQGRGFVVTNPRQGLIAPGVNHLGGARVDHLYGLRDPNVYDRGVRHDRFGRHGFGRHGVVRHDRGFRRHNRFWAPYRRCNFFRPRYNRFAYCRPYVPPVVAYDYYSPFVTGFVGGVSVFPGFGLDDIEYDYDQDITIINNTTEVLEQPVAPPVETTVIYETGESPVVIESQPAQVFDAAPVQSPQTTLEAPPVTDTAVAGPPSLEDLAQSEPDLLDLGNAAFNQGDYREALRSYIAAIMSDETNGYPRLFYGVGQFALGDYSLAAIGIRRALAVSPDLIANPIDVRSIYPAESVFLEHMRNLQVYLVENPTDTEAKFLLGYLHFASASPENALSLFSATLADVPGDSLVLELQKTASDIVSQGFQANP